ncbi:putative RNA-directed DNA polymerase [Helianthus annuus]|nr:putative RNA-directed DNA polymerase [Helianthus annuus]
MSELDNYDVDCYTDIEKNDKLLDALPAKWDIYTLMIKGEADYDTKELEEVVGKLRAYELSMKKKDTGYDQVQDPGIYNGLTSSSSHDPSSDSATSFLSCDNEQVIVNEDGDVCFVAAVGGSTGVKRTSTSKQSSNAKSMPMSVKSAEEHLALLASFVASYENYIQGKISDPATLDEDYDQIDPDDLEEMDLQWQMAMISRRVKRFMNRTGRKFVGKNVGFDKAKVKCFNCQSYGHFARECQKEKHETSSQSSNNRNSSNNSNSRALISTAREGSYDWSIHLENDENVTQAFMAEIVPVDEGEATVVDEKTTEAEEDKADQATDAEKEKPESEHEMEADEKDEIIKRMGAQLAALMANSDKATREVSNSATSVCLKCRELQGEVDKLSTQNKSLVSEMSNVKESNFFAKRNESSYLKKIKGYEAEIEALTCKLNEKLQVIDLAHDMMAEKTKEISDRNKELSDAQLKIVELEKKLGQFFVMKHMMGGLKKSNDKKTVGFQGFNEVPPPLSHDYSFLPNEDEFTDFLSTSPSSFTSSQGDVFVDNDAKKENNSKPVLKKKNTPSKNNNQTFVKKVNFVQGSDMKTETAVIEEESNVEFAKNKNIEKSEIKQTDQNPSKASSSEPESSSKASGEKSLKRRSCFKCHTKGHVASCCPNKKVEAQLSEKQRGKSQEKNGDKKERESNSPKKSAPKQQQGVASGVDKAEKGTPQVPRFQRNQPRFQPESTSGRYERPRSSSPRMNNQNSNNFRSQGQYQNRYHNNGGRTFYNNGFRNYNNQASWNQNSSIQRSHSPNTYRNPQDQRPYGNPAPFPSTGPRSKTPVRSDGHWMDVPVVDESGRPKTIKAWLLRRIINLWYVDSGCSRHMTGDATLFSEFEEYDGGHVNFAAAKGGRITGRGKVTNGKITLDKVNYVEQLKHNLMSVSQVCDKGHSVHFTNTGALVLKPGLVIPDDWIVMRAPRKNDTYVMDMGAKDPTAAVACLLSKASEAESMLWHRRMAHIHYRKMNYIIKNELVKGVPLLRFQVEDKCLPCQKGKQHKKPHKSKTVNSINAPYELLHMDLFGPVNVRSIGGKYYCLVVTDNYSRYSWVFFLGTKDETTEMLIDLFTKLENVHDARIKRIRSDNGTEFKNRILDLYCLRKGIEHQYSAPYTPQQNGVAERKNRTLIEAARTMLSDSKLPVLFWGEAMNTACYVLNKVLTVKHFNKTCHELMFNEKPNLTGFEPFGLPCTIVRNKDKQKFGEVADEGYFQGYVPGTPNKRVFNQKTDDSQLIQTVIGEDDEGEFMPRSNVDMSDAPETSHGAADPDSSDSEPEPNQGEDFINPFANQNIQGEVGSNLGDNLEVDVVATTRANRDHPVDMIRGDPTAGVQTRRSIAANSGLFVSIEKTGIVNECLYSCFISQEEPKNIHMALKDNSWVEVMQEKLAQFAKLKVWELVDLPKGEREIRTKWVFRCKKDERGIVTRNKARLVVKGFNQQEGIDYNEVFAPVV